MAQATNLLQGPNPIETAELHFKLHCRLKVFETSTMYEQGHSCILAVSQYYGLIFVGNLNGFSVISTKSLTAGISPEKYPKKNITLNLRPSHLSVDISQKILAVVCNSKPSPIVILYNIQSFAGKDVPRFLKLTRVATLVPNLTAEVLDLSWQPNADGSFVLCMSDGSVLALPQGTKNDTVFTLPGTIQATCFCWSPKGKQIVIGTASGTLSQYKPDLKLVKTLPAPPLFNGAVMVVSVLWISSFQFAVAYNDRANPETFPVFTIVNAAKNEPINVINYDDITYSSTLFRNHQIYMSHQSAWNLIFVSSANSIEVAVLHLKDNISWEQWLLGDASRAELPLNPDRQETLPLGWAFDFTSQEGIPWGEGSLPPMPRLLLVSDEGLLCVFNIVNASENAPQLCAPPKESFDDSVFTVSEKTPPPAAAEPATTVPSGKGLLGSPPTFGSAKPAIDIQLTPGFGGFAPKPQTKPLQESVVSSQPQPEQPQVQIQQQQPPPPVQVQQQQQQQLQLPQQPQPQIQQKPLSLTTQPTTTTPFALSTSLFGSRPKFSFGESLNTSFAKPITTERPTTATTGAPTTTTATAISFSLQPSASQKDLFGAKNLPQSTPIKQPEVSIIKTTSPVPVAKKPEEVESTVAEAEDNSAETKRKIAEVATVDASVYLNALADEIEHFNSELQQLSQRIGNLDTNVGTEEEKTKLKSSIEGLESFCKDVKETTESQSGEVHAVVTDLMEAFAWLEDAKSRNLQRKNPSYIELKKSEELDPLNARHMNEISHLKYYIENQLKQLSGYLEKEWADHQENYRNEVKNKMAVPLLEEIYKTMHYQMKIIQKQRATIEEIREKMANKKRKNKSQNFSILPLNMSTPTNVNGNRASELSKLAENLLQLKIDKEEDSPQSGALEIMKLQLNSIADRSKKLTREKQNALRDLLSERDMVKIRPVKTTFERSSFLRTFHSDKATAKPLKPKPLFKFESQKQTEPTPMKQNTSAPETEEKTKSVIGSPVQIGKTEEKPIPASKPEPPKGTPVEMPKITVPIQFSAPQEVAKTDAVTTGKKNDNVAFTAKSVISQSEPAKEPIIFEGAKQEQKPEEPKTSQLLTFGLSKPTESSFGKKDPTIFGAKPTFNLPSSITVVMTKSEMPKTPPAPNITIAPVTTAPVTTFPFSFSFTATTSAPTSFSFGAPTTTASSLPKVNLSFTKEETTSTFGTPSAAESIFSAAPTTSTSFFGSSTPLFFGAKTTTTSTISTPLFGTPKTTADSQPSSLTLTQSSDSKTPPVSESVTVTIKPTTEKEEVDVLEVEEPQKKPETPMEKTKDSPKATVPPTVFTSPLPPKPTSEVTSTVSSSPTISITTTTTPTSAINVFTKPAVTTAPATTVTTVTTTSGETSTATPATTASVFSFSSVAAPVFFTPTQTPTTTTATTATSLFGTPTTTTSIFGQVSSTTPTPSIFGGSTPTALSSNIFGGSRPVETASGQPSTPATTTGTIFGGSTPTTNAFGQASTPNATTFGQKSNSVDTTANLYSQLLSDGNKSVFGGSPTTNTTTNFFSTPKNTFTTASLFGSSFGSSIFGQATTTSSIFGQPQTTTSNSFFGGGSQNLFSGFSKETPTTSTQDLRFKSGFKSGDISASVFGQSTFAQGFKSSTFSSSFGGTAGSIFGGSSTPTTGNLFQTPTTSSTFGSPPPGPYSGGTTTFGETTFGSSPSTIQKPLGGFGSQPVFGGGPTAPAFGASPSFGSLPTFGSVSQGAFSQTTGSTTFENLANQDTVGFGNLAQQSQSQGFGGGFGSSSFDNKPAFAGNSFSSWRSK